MKLAGNGYYSERGHSLLLISRILYDATC